MLRPRTVWVLLVMLPALPMGQGFVKWLFGDDPPAGGAGGPPGGEEEYEVERTPEFEMQTADETFLAQANFIKDLSPLDVCHHRVVAELQQTCSDLTEEGMAKLAVQLLNCQSAAEARTVYPCKPDMSIAECTRDMDPTTWNAYQIVSNRARAICYATRQQQFRFRTEYTVNQLVHTTENQIAAMEQLQTGQEKLESATQNAIDEVKSGQEEMMTNQEKIKTGHMAVHSYLSGNLRELAREKALIATGNKELAEMTEGIRVKIDEANARLADQGSQQQENHADLLHDLSSLRDRAKDVLHKLDASSRHMMDFHEETSQHYQETLANLQRVNSTVNYVIELLNATRQAVEGKINWLLSLVGGTGDKVQHLYVIVLHVVYFLLAAVSASFLHTPTFTRITLLITVPLNAWAELRHMNSLGFLAMTTFIGLSVAANWAITAVMYLCTRKKVPAPPSTPVATTGLEPLAVVPSRLMQSEGATDPHSTPTSGHMAAGIASPDLRKLVTMLEKIYHSGVVSPASHHGNQSFGSRSIANTPVSVVKPLKEVDQSILSHLPLKLPATPSSKMNESLSVEAVKRHLLHTLDNSVTTSVPLKHEPPSHTSTPLKPTPKRRLSRSTPNRSNSTPLCLATTRVGQPCKLHSLDGSAFCHRHQVTGLTTSKSHEEEEES